MQEPFKKKRVWRIGLAVSGGADSTALLAALADLRETLGFRAVVLHVDHGLRPDSHDDARFVADLAARFDLPCHTLRARIRRRPRESLEMAARRTRLAFFARMTRTLGLDAIATGHHADDVAETFIMRMARGAGPEGLAGLKPVSHVDGITFIRPLLGLRDSDLRAYLRRRGLTWREDSTNADTSILRNKVRHVILPFLREHLDPHITAHLCKSAAILRGDLSGGRASPRAASGGRASPRAAPGGRASPRADYRLAISPATGYTPRAESIGVLPAVCEMSRAALAGRTLEVRRWRAGDRIAPTGLNGHSRKLQDVFMTAKVPPSVRTDLPLICDAATGEVLWVPGYRIAQSVAVESTIAPSWRFTLSSNG
ncbi:MAG: tRNA lysidine(34) synthetase TilS [Kiritimatiellae bacterium]|nr:tRNA lysidine(34) synthetase TilS [Kiritimatiellia bacterium]